jgi:hypothetical protein
MDTVLLYEYNATLYTMDGTPLSDPPIEFYAFLSRNCKDYEEGIWTENEIHQIRATAPAKIMRSGFKTKFIITIGKPISTGKG